MKILALSVVEVETNNAGDLLKKVYYFRDAQGNCMSIYTLTQEGTMPDLSPIYELDLTERSIYGSSRVGTENPEDLLIARSYESLIHEFDYVQTIGDRRYELSNHLGNVLEVVTDRKLAIETTPASGIFDHYAPDVVAQNDYYPFGMLMPNRNESSSDYRYGFQGQEKDDEIKGDGNSVNYKYRMHDPRVGRFFAVDPLAFKYSYNSPYAFSENRVIDGLEFEGLEVNLINENGELTPGPWSSDYADNTPGVGTLQDVVQNEELEEAFVELYFKSETFSDMVHEQQFFDKSLITAWEDQGVVNEYTDDGKTDAFDDFGKGKDPVQHNRTIIYLGVLGEVEKRMAYEMTNSKSYLQGNYGDLLTRARDDASYTFKEYSLDAARVEAESAYNSAIVMAELAESEGREYSVVAVIGPMSAFDGFNLEMLKEHKNEIIEAYTEELSEEYSRHVQQHSEEYDMQRSVNGYSESIDQD